MTEHHFVLWGATEISPWGPQDFEQVQMWVTEAGRERVQGSCMADQGCKVVVSCIYYLVRTKKWVFVNDVRTFSQVRTSGRCFMTKMRLAGQS